MTGKRKYWLYSEDDSVMMKANQMYASFGFKAVRVEPLLGRPVKRIWYELDLTKQPRSKL